MEALLLLLLVLSAAAFASHTLSRRLARRGGRQAVAQAEVLYSGVHEFVSVDSLKFPWLDARFYDDTRAWLGEQGFRYLGDVENTTLTQQHPNLRTFIRVMSGDSGEVCLGLYQVKLRGISAPLQWLGVLPRRLCIVDVSSELSDGRFLCTNNASGVDTTPSPRDVEVQMLAPKTPPEQVLERHRLRLRNALEASPGLRARRVASLNEALAAQARLQLLKNTVMDREGLVRTIEGQPGMRQAKDWMIEEVRRS